MVKKDRSDESYQRPIKKYATPILSNPSPTHLTRAQFLVLSILLDLLQSERQVKLERLASAFPYPITTESRRWKLQRFLDLPKLTISQICYPLITY